MYHTRWVRLVMCALLGGSLLLALIWSLLQYQPHSQSRVLRLSHELHTVNYTHGLSHMKHVLGSNLHECDTDIRPRAPSRMLNDVWHVQEVENQGQVFIFSAFYDDRPVFDGHVYLRLFAITNFKLSNPLYCQVWYDSFSSPFISTANWQDTGRGLNVYSVHYQERLLTCEVPRIPNMYPSHVSLHSEACGVSTILVPVVIPERDLVHDVGICVVIAYGDLNPGNLVEWVELNRMLGVGEINVYDSRLSDRTRAVFQYYSDNTAADPSLNNSNTSSSSNGPMVVVRKSAPALDNWCKWCQKLSVIPALNDCMYRNMYRYRHLAAIDFDEFIIPRKEQSLPEMLRTVGSTWRSAPPGYLFQNTYFFLDTPPSYKEPGWLVTPRYVERQEPSSHSYSPKSIIDPRRCLVMQNHYCMVRTPDVRGQFALYVDARYALSHHYKSCHFGAAQCKEMCSHTTRDETARRFVTPLRAAVGEVRARRPELFPKE